MANLVRTMQTFRKSLTKEEAYNELLDTNKELRKELEDEITINDIYNKKLNTLTKELERCYRTISHQDSTILAHEEEIASLKSDIKSLKQRLYKALQDLRHKGNASTAQDIHILRLEDNVEQLKKRIREITNKKLSPNNSSPMAGQALLINIGTNIDLIERYIGGNIAIDPVVTLNAIRLTLTQVREHMQRTTQDVINNHNNLTTANTQINNLRAEIARMRDYQEQQTRLSMLAYNNEVNDRRRWCNFAQELQTLGLRMSFRKQNRISELIREKVALQLLNRRRKAEADLAEFNRAWVFNRYQKWKVRELNSRQIILNLQNNPLQGNMANLGDVNKLLAPLLAGIPFYDGQEEPDSYYAKLRTINESARPLAVAGFDAATRANVMKGKMTGRFHPVPATNPYNAGANINTEAEFLNWLQGKYREVMVGTNQDAQIALMNEKFTPGDTADSYEKRIKIYAQGIPFANVLPYLYRHMPQYMEMRLRQANPANLDAFFTNLRTIWLESRGRFTEQTPSFGQTLTIQPQKDDFRARLAKDLQYSGISSDDASLEKFIYDELKRRLGGQTAHVRKSPFTPKTAYATKKVIRKVVANRSPKASTKLVRHCSTCGKTGHTKVNCPKVKRTKKVHYVYQDEVDDSEDEYLEEEDEYIEEEDEYLEEEEEEETEDDDNNESRNCYAIKKKWSEKEYL